MKHEAISRPIRIIIVQRIRKSIAEWDIEDMFRSRDVNI